MSNSHLTLGGGRPCHTTLDSWSSRLGDPLFVFEIITDTVCLYRGSELVSVFIYVNIVHTITSTHDQLGKAKLCLAPLECAIILRNCMACYTIVVVDYCVHNFLF